MDFDAAYPLYRREILSLSRSPFLDLEPDDIESEMTVALWRATQTYDPAKTDTPFGTYWWSCWKNRRSDLAAKFYAQKRIHPDLVEPNAEVLDRTCDRRPFPAPPPGTSAVGVTLWGLLATGETGVDAMAQTEVTKRVYYAQIKMWRTDSVKGRLRSK